MTNLKKMVSNLEEIKATELRDFGHMEEVQAESEGIFYVDEFITVGKRFEELPEEYKESETADQDWLEDMDLMDTLKILAVNAYKEMILEELEA